MPMPRRKADDDEDVEPHTGEANIGTIQQLTEKEPVGWQFQPIRASMGFDITPSKPGAKRRRRRRK